MISRAAGVVLGILAFVPAIPFPKTLSGQTAGGRVFSVLDFGATGKRSVEAQAAIQKAVDACAESGGGMVYFPPGEYVTGTIHLRSRVRIYIEAGATVLSIHDKRCFDKDALLYGEDLRDVTIEGRGTFNGEAGYDWRPMGDFRDDFIRPNQVEMEKLGLPLVRSFPKSGQTGKMVLLVRCRDVRITGVTFVDSPSWTIHPVACERLVIDGISIFSSLREGVWADGIDPDGCKDVRISNCTIETGDDALVFYSMDWFGPARPCENITVTNCRLSSASSALKFCDGNIAGIRNVVVDNCVITGSNRGIAFMTFDGGAVENVILSNLTIDCARHDWFWWGDGEPFHFNVRKRSEVHAGWPREKDRPAGVVRNVKIQNVIAHGYGSSICNGHPESWLEGISFENVRILLRHDPNFPYDKSVNILEFRQARNVRFRDVELTWEEPLSDKWRSALLFDEVDGLTIDGIVARQAPGERTAPAVMFREVRDARVRNCRAEKGTETFLLFSGAGTRDILVHGNDFSLAANDLAFRDGASESSVRTPSIVRRNDLEK